MWAFIISFFISFSIISFLIFSKVLEKFNLFLDRKDEEKPQKVHKNSVPRAGWLGIISGFSLGVFTLKNLLGIKLLAAALPLLIGGIVEDFKRISYKVRFLFMFTAATLAIVLLDAVVLNLGFGKLPLILGIIFSIVALVGAVNAYNIIDGINGLSSGLGLIAAITYAYLAFKLDLFELYEINMVFIGAVLGFFLWNFPFGKVFLGDTGSYFIGFFVGVTSILIAGGKYSGVSPWVPVVVMFYPVWETLFSIYRRLKNGKNPFEPDKEHFHHLLFEYFGKSHLKATGLILLVQALASFCAAVYHSNTPLLIILSLLLMALHLYGYNLLKKRIKGNLRS